MKGYSKTTNEARPIFLGRCIRPANLEVLSKPIEDFGNHLREVFAETNYGITSAEEFQVREGYTWLAQFGVYRLIHNSDGRGFMNNAGYVVISNNPEKRPNTQIGIMPLGRPIDRELQERIEHYDLSEIDTYCTRCRSERFSS